MFQRRLRGGVLTGLLVCSLSAPAAPADDHQRGLQAYHRGDVAGAMSALRPAAQAGYAPAQSLLGFILENGDFREEAARLYSDAAAQDDAEGHAGLAGLLLSGRGVAKDEKLALSHFSKAADLGHAASIEVLVRVYQNGLYGVAPDPAQAAAWRARAAALRKPTAASAAAKAPP
jgi:TPR repeat protein